MAQVLMNNVSKHFGESRAVSNLTIDIADGEFLVFVGPSGCGKTTSLRMLAGLESSTYGSIFIGDRDVTRLPPGKRNVAMVFQNYALYPHLTVAKNLSFGPSIRHETKTQLPARVKSVAELLNIDMLLNRKPGALSGGQRQRVALGRALMRQPDLFLLDEPLSNLDAALRVQMRQEIVRVHENLRTTTVYVTHDQVEAMTMGDRIAVMNQGQLLQVGTPDNLYNDPVDMFVGTFLGTPRMNTIDCQIRVLSSSNVLLNLFGMNAELPQGTSEELSTVIESRDAMAVTAGIRPADLRIREGHEGTQDVSVTGVVRTIEHLGSLQNVGLDIGGVRITATASKGTRLRKGETAELSFDLHDLYFFNSSSGKRLMSRTLGSGSED